MLKVGILVISIVAANPAAAVVDINKVPARVFATFSEMTVGQGVPLKLAYYKNEDVVNTTSVTVTTPHVTVRTVTEIVRTPVIIQVPVLVSKGKPVVVKGVPVTRNKTIIVDVSTIRNYPTTTFTSVKTYYTAVTPKSELYLTSGRDAIVASPLVNFEFLDPVTRNAPSYLTGIIPAALTLAGLSTNVVNVSGTEFSQIFDTLHIDFALPAPIGPQPNCADPVCPFKSNLLSVDITDAVLSGTLGSNNYTISASNPTSGLTYASDFLNFSNDFNHGISLTFSAASVALKLAPAFVSPATAANTTGSRTFANNRTRIIGAFLASAVPEPKTWSMMMAAFVMVGLRLRRRSAPSATA